MIGTDCDADLCYLSERTHPPDVIRESYALERAMLARGWRTAVSYTHLTLPTN